jgi:hypothetical protein
MDPLVDDDKATSAHTSHFLDTTQVNYSALLTISMIITSSKELCSTELKDVNLSCVLFVTIISFLPPTVILSSFQTGELQELREDHAPYRRVIQTGPKNMKIEFQAME